MSSARLAAAVGLIAVLGAALVVVLVRGSQSSAERPPSAQISPSPSLTLSVDVVDAPEGDYPTPANTGEATSEEDFERIFREIAAFRTWLYRNPDPELASLIYDPGCDCYETFVSQLQSLRNQHLRYADEGTQIHDIVLDSQPTPGFAVLRVVTSHGVQRVVGGDGNLVKEGPGWEPHVEQMTLVRGNDDRWRVVHGQVLGAAS